MPHQSASSTLTNMMNDGLVYQPPSIKKRKTKQGGNAAPYVLSAGRKQGMTAQRKNKILLFRRVYGLALQLFGAETWKAFCHALDVFYGKTFTRDNAIKEWNKYEQDLVVMKKAFPEEFAT